jgi:hypothetical protein
MIQQSLAKFLRNNANITAAVNTIAPLMLEADADYPAMVYYVASDERPALLNGGTSSMSRANAEIDILAESYAKARETADIVLAEMHDYTGAFGDHFAEQIKVDGDLDTFENAVMMYRVNLQMVIHYTQGA